MSNNKHSRRQLLRTAAAVAAFGASPIIAEAAPLLEEKKEQLKCEEGGCCIIKSGDFYNVERGHPIPYKQPIEKLREIGMVRETWQLEVIADPQSNSKIKQPLLKADGTALTFDALLKLAETKAVSYFKVITCNNLLDPLGHGLWEGVPLRDLLWMTGPVENLRHVYYYGHHNEDPKQIFKCYLPMNRVFEDPPGELPVILAYKLNGEFLTGERGGPVRMIVPEAYGFKNVKWLQRIVFTNNHQSDDTYAGGNNDINSWLKTFARFGQMHLKFKAADPLTIHGKAQIGVSGLTKVQYWIRNENDPLPKDDPYFTTIPWQDARILPFDEIAMKDFDLSHAHPLQFDRATRKPTVWPMRYSLCAWTAEPRTFAAGKYELRCRTIDQGGFAQPMPRPFPKSGKNGIETVSIEVT